MSVEKTISRYAKVKAASRLGRYADHKGLKWLLAGIYTQTAAHRLDFTYRCCRPSLPAELPSDAGFVVSLTSFPPRMGTLWMVVDLLMRQTLRPAEIVLNLFEGDFPNGLADIPESLRPYMDLGLRIHFVSENLRSHLKYHYTFIREAAGLRRPVITVDDDLFYPLDAFERLMGLHVSNPGCICANTARRITRLPSGAAKPYREWEDVLYAEPASDDKIALGFGGVLYPAEFYCRAENILLDRKKVVDLCLKADDLWLKACEMRDGFKVVCGEYFPLPVDIPSSQQISLSRQNVGESANDRYWAVLESSIIPQED